MINPSQRPLPDNTQHSQQTNIQAPGGIRTHNRSRRAAVDLRLRPRGHWDRLLFYNTNNKNLGSKTKVRGTSRERVGPTSVRCLLTRVGNLIVATIYLQLIQNRYMFRSFTVLQCSHQHCVQPVASDVEVVRYL